MKYPVFLQLLVPLIAMLLSTTLHADTEPTSVAIGDAVRRATTLLEMSADEYTKHRQCFSCHHQQMPMIALTAARDRGFRIDNEIVQNQTAFTLKSLENNRENYAKGKGQGGQISTAGSALWALDAGEWKPDATTSAVVEYLLLWDRDRDHWRTTSKRPPSEASDMTTTYLALRGISNYGSAPQKERLNNRLDKVRGWILSAPVNDTEDRVFRLLAMPLAKVAESRITQASEELQKQQRADGGWRQTESLESDAYATGSVLAALHLAGNVPVTDPAYRRGLKYLLEKQRPDGSWFVASRSRPFQTYFESGFPHEKNQFISIAATSWATYALALAADRESKKQDSAAPTKRK